LKKDRFNSRDSKYIITKRQITDCNKDAMKMLRIASNSLNSFF
jgi:hypothetical protein